MGEQRDAVLAPDLVALEHTAIFQEVDRVVVSDAQRFVGQMPRAAR